VTSGIRLGTPAVTTRGMKEEDMRQIARAISLALGDLDKNREEVLGIVDELCKRYPLYDQGILK